MKEIITAILAFASTNIDDIFILMLFYGDRKFKRPHIILGQYFGIFTLVGLSFLGAYLGHFVDQRFVGLLGLFPIYLACKHVIEMSGRKHADNPSELSIKSSGIIAIAGVTIANGGDNIGIYIPLLTTLDTFERIQFLIIFLVMVYLWCMAAKYLAARPVVARQLERHGHIIMPVVLFFLGVFILIESNSLSLLTT